MATPSDLSTLAACYCFPNLEQFKSVIVYLLVRNANLLGMTPQQLAAASSCFCYNNDQWKQVVAFLLSTGGSGGGGAVCILGGVGPPGVLPVPCSFSAYIQQPGPNFGLWLGDLSTGWAQVITQGP